MEHNLLFFLVHVKVLKGHESTLCKMRELRSVEMLDTNILKKCLDDTPWCTGTLCC